MARMFIKFQLHEHCHCPVTTYISAQSGFDVIKVQEKRHDRYNSIKIDEPTHSINHGDNRICILNAGTTQFIETNNIPCLHLH